MWQLERGTDILKVNSKDKRVECENEFITRRNEE